MGLTAIAAVTWGCYSALIGIGAGAWLHDHTLVAVAVGVVGGLAIGLVIDWVLRKLTHHRPVDGRERTGAPGGRRVGRPTPRSRRLLRSQDAHDPTPLPNDPVSLRHFAHDCAYSLTVSTSRSALPCLTTPPGVSVGMGGCGQGARWACVRGGPSASCCPLRSCWASPRAAPPARRRRTRPTAVVVGAADCLSSQVLADLGLVAAGTSGGTGTPHADAPDAGRVPDGFLPVSVVVCAPGGTLQDSSGTWVALTASRREGDLEPLVAALRRPSAQRGGTCSSAAVVAPSLWLVDALGRAIRPVWPTDRVRRSRRRRCPPRWTRSRRRTASSTRSGS